MSIVEQHVCLPVDCCFSELALTQHVGLIQHIIHQNITSDIAEILSVGIKKQSLCGLKNNDYNICMLK